MGHRARAVGRKVCVCVCVCVAGAAVPLSVVGGAGAGSPSVASKTTSPGPRPISVPSGILHHSTVWLQYVTLRKDRTDRQTDNGPIA